VDLTVLIREINFGLLNRDPGPVTHLQVLAGDLVQDSSFAYIGVTRESYGNQS
jgi:hypothetical protein